MDTTGKPVLYLKTIVSVVVGILLSVIDNFASGGELSPIVIVVLLFVAVLIYGLLWGWKGWNSAVATWMWLPLIHLVKRAANLPDTIHPNTFQSILLLAVFSLVVSGVGLSLGAIINRLFYKEKETR